MYHYTLRFLKIKCVSLKILPPFLSAYVMALIEPLEWEILFARMGVKYKRRKDNPRGWWNRPSLGKGKSGYGLGIRPVFPNATYYYPSKEYQYASRAVLPNRRAIEWRRLSVSYLFSNSSVVP